MPSSGQVATTSGTGTCPRSAVRRPRSDRQLVGGHDLEVSLEACRTLAAIADANLDDRATPRPVGSDVERHILAADAESRRHRRGEHRRPEARQGRVLRVPKQPNGQITGADHERPRGRAVDVGDRDQRLLDRWPTGPSHGSCKAHARPSTRSVVNLTALERRKLTARGANRGADDLAGARAEQHRQGRQQLVADGHDAI